MPKYIIEREFPGAGNLSKQELKDISLKSVNVISEMGPEIKWIQSYVTGNKLYCVYVAANKELLVKHAQIAGFPINVICEISSTIDPFTAEN